MDEKANGIGATPDTRLDQPSSSNTQPLALQRTHSLARSMSMAIPDAMPPTLPEAEAHADVEHHHQYIFKRLRKRLPPPSSGRLKAVV